VLVFRIDASVVPAGGVQAITVFRDGVSVAACNASPPRPAGTADPDPCVSSRVPLSDGDAQITVLTSKLSDWAVAHDVVAPTVALVRPARGEAFTINQSAAASYSCADGGSGVSSCTGAVADGAPIPTSQAGFNTFTVTATDAAGNATTVSHQYQVLYPFAGFFSPLENPGHIEGLLNEVKAGASVPLKFSLSGHRGLGIWAQQPATQRIACDSTAPVDAVEETVTSTSSLTYNASTDTYSYVLKTDKSWAGTCRRATLTLLDGSKHSADFLFR